VRLHESKQTRSQEHSIMQRYREISGLGVLIGSFILTLWLTAPTTPIAHEPEPANMSAAVLAAYLVPNERILAAAASAAGLQLSDKLRGFVDEIARNNKQQVTIRGWAADLVSQGTPLTILIFADGRNMLVTQTKGPRDDVAQALKVSAPAAANVAFEGEFSCSPGEALVVVAVTQKNSYAPLNQAARPLICPS
jgi:hypothetical protein